jgi:hypothetical protein
MKRQEIATLGGKEGAVVPSSAAYFSPDRDEIMRDRKNFVASRKSS